jgi:hypothetical protein
MNQQELRVQPVNQLKNNGPCKEISRYLQNECYFSIMFLPYRREVPMMISSEERFQHSKTSRGSYLP